jgi:hypothetical protein
VLLESITRLWIVGCVAVSVAVKAPPADDESSDTLQSDFAIRLSRPSQPIRLTLFTTENYIWNNNTLTKEVNFKTPFNTNTRRYQHRSW